MGAPERPTLSTPNRVALDDASQYKNYGEIKSGLDGFAKTFGAMDPTEIAQMKALTERNLNNYGLKAITDAKNTAAGSGLSPTSVIKAQSDFADKAIDKMGELDYNITKSNRELSTAGKMSWLEKMMQLSQGVAGTAQARFNQENAIANMANQNELKRYEIDRENDVDWGSILGGVLGKGIDLFSGGMGSGWLGKLLKLN